MTPTSAISAALERLPHAPPFRFVSEVIVLEPGIRAEGLWVVSGTEDFFRGHFPGEPIVPGVLIGEALAQLAGLVAIAGVAGPTSRGRLARIDLKFPAAVVPPASVGLRAELTRAMDRMALFDVAASHDSRTVAIGQLVIAISREGSP
jgi:3-hydroxyacyl-[acyl-carrier-protein] dehydratase